MAKYLYLPRLRDENVLLAAIRSGIECPAWQTETFAYAEGWDEVRRRYQGLAAGQTTRILIDDRSVLVKPEVALAQMQREQQTAKGTAGTGTADDASRSAAAHTETGGVVVVEPRVPDAEPPPPERRRFHGSVVIDPVRLGRDAAQIAEEVVQHLTRIVGAQIAITLEIHAELPEGASDKLVRDVTENCRTLRFDTFGFEEL
jgi:hypothetical protein